MVYHKPVLLKESIDALVTDENGIYVDVTFGGGGHSREILSRLKKGKLIAFDQDKDAEQNMPDDERIIFIRHNFRYMKNFLKYYGLKKVNGIIADLGVSSHHFDTAGRGFAFRLSAPLDMRMNVDTDFSALDVVNKYSADKLNHIFREYGEIRNPDRISQAIITLRQKEQIETTEQLLGCIEQFAPKFKEYKFLAKVFQAIRIEVNQEMESLREFLTQSAEVLTEGGRLVVIAYHSLEDRLVKNFMRTGTFEQKEAEKDFFGNLQTPLRMSTGKPVVPDDDELQDNNRSRSAKMRVAEKRANR